MKKVIILLLISMVSCKTPKVGMDQLDLENISLDFNVDGFYADEIYKAVTFKKEQENRAALLQKWGGFHEVVLDTIYDDDNNEQKLLAIEYKMPSSAEGDSLGYYGNKYFDKVEMLKSSEGNLMALLASAFVIGEEDGQVAVTEYKDLLQYLTGKYGKPMIEKDAFYNEQTMYSWSLDDRVVVTTSNAIIVDFFGSEQDEAEQQNVIETKLFVIDKAHKALLTEKIEEGEWLMLR